MPGTFALIVDILVKAEKPVWAVFVLRTLRTLLAVRVVRVVLVVLMLAALEDTGVPSAREDEDEEVEREVKEGEADAEDVDDDRPSPAEEPARDPLPRRIRKFGTDRLSRVKAGWLGAVAEAEAERARVAG